jgi:uncharacterized SAM-binding protein YcdF (DUF218 family)
MDETCAEIAAPAEALETIAAYLAVRDSPRNAGLIVGLGSDSADVADQAANLHRLGFAPLILFSGGRGRLTGALPGTEADFLKERAIERGVAPQYILTESESTNTLENVRFSVALLGRLRIAPTRVILVTQPVLQRRAWATVQRQWQAVECLNCPPQPNLRVGWEDPGHIAGISAVALGEIERLRRYSLTGDIEPQCLPANVERAYRTLSAITAP